MRIKAISGDEQVSGDYAAFYDFCDEMKWDRFVPNQSDFIHKGWRVSIEHEVGHNVWMPCSKPPIQSSRQRVAKTRQRYTDSLRPFNRSCKQCVFNKDNTCAVGDFKVKQGGGCIQFKGKLI